jgi:ABC-type uncharacterized transport system auxiliary subunit
MRRSVSILALLVCAAGCVTSRPVPPTQQYRLDYVPPQADSEPLPVVVRVARFHAAEPYARNEIVYREGGHRIGSDVYHRWAADPASMVATLIARDLASSGGYRAVLHGPSPVRIDYEIEAEIEAIEEGAGSPCTAHLEIRALLVRARASHDPVLFQRPYEANEPCAAGEVGDLVEAMGRALASISAELRHDVHAAIAADLEARQSDQH